MTVLMTNKDAFAGASHTILLVMFLQTLETGEDRGVFFGLVLLGTESIVR